MPDTSTTNPQGSSVWDYVTNFLPGGGGNNSNVSGNMIIPAIAQAYQQYRNSGTYRDLGTQAAAVANPFGGYRKQYGDELSALYADPSKIADTPGYKFTMDQSLDQTQKRLAAMGYGGSSEMQAGLEKQAAGIASQTWNTEADRLAKLAGADFNPAYAAQAMMEGGKLSVDSQNAALAALFAPFGNKAGSQVAGGGTPSSNAQIPPQIQQAATAAANRFGAQAGQTVMQLWSKYMTSPGDMSPSDIQMLQSFGVNTGMDTGGMDFAPGNFQTGEFGGFGTGNPNDPGFNYQTPGYDFTGNAPVYNNPTDPNSYTFDGGATTTPYIDPSFGVDPGTLTDTAPIDWSSSDANWLW